MEIYHGDILYSGSWEQFKIHTDSYILVENGFGKIFFPSFLTVIWDILSRIMAEP